MTAREADEVVTAVRLPAEPAGRRGTSFVEFARRHDDFAIAGAAAAVSLAGDGTINVAQLALAGVGPHPVRVEAAGRRRGVAPDALALDDIAAETRRAIEPRGDIHASARFRRHLARNAHGAGARSRGSTSSRTGNAPLKGPSKRVSVEPTVNGSPYVREVEARLLLSDFLRHELGFTGTHLGCEHGVCGACTVHLDGRAVRSCLLFAVQASGRAPGFVMSVAAILDDVPGLDDRELRELLSGNICRCTGYVGIVPAARRAAAIRQETGG